MSSLEHREHLVHIAFDASRDVPVASVLHADEETRSEARRLVDDAYGNVTGLAPSRGSSRRAIYVGVPEL